MSDFLEIFMSMFLLMFGIFCLIFGCFTAYFGTGRSRNIGGSLILFGIVAFIIVLWFTAILPFAAPLAWSMDQVLASFIAVVAFILGLLAALGIFLGAIMKS